MAHVVEFVGIPTGDGESPCVNVDEKTYRRVEGDESWKAEKSWRDDPEERKFLGSDYMDNQPWRLYFPFCLKVREKRCRIRVQIEVLDE